MNCINCGAFLTDTDLDYCPHCGANVLIQKKVDYLSKLYYNQGLEKASIRDLSGAISCLKQSLAYDKRNIRARNLLGLVYFETGEVVAALSEWVISKTLLQTADRPGQIPDAGFFQPLIIIKLGKIIHLLLDQYIGSTVRTIIQICIRQERSTVYAVHSLLLILHVCCS